MVKAYTLEYALESKIERIPFSDCWWFIRHQVKGGYSYVEYGGKREMAHRAAYRLWKGVDPGNLLVCHQCDNPCCVNPAHLFLGTAKDNAQDRDRKGRANRRFGNRHPFCKITDQQVKEIKSLFAGGMKQKAIGQLFDIGQSRVSAIVRGKRDR